MRPNKSFKLSQLLTKIKRKSIAFTGQDEFDKMSQSLAIIFQVYRIIDANSYENVCIVIHRFIFVIVLVPNVVSSALSD